jgi:hypothetical protein
MSTHQPAAAASPAVGWSELWRKEDWWAVWLGLGTALIAYALFANGTSIGWIAVAPQKWATFHELAAHFQANVARYLARFAILLGLFSIAASAIGYSVRHFVPGFLLVYLLSIAVFAAGTWEKAAYYNVEPPLIALVLGLLIANLTGLPRWLEAGFRVEFYIKTGIVLLGATLPFTLIIWAGPVAILQASIVSILTFLTIFLTGRYSKPQVSSDRHSRSVGRRLRHLER